MKKPSNRPKKLEDPLGKARECLRQGLYLDTIHGSERRVSRSVPLTSIEAAISNGHWEKRKDEYSEWHKAWNYAIRGSDIDGRELRVIVSFDNQTLLLITVYEI